MQEYLYGKATKSLSYNDFVNKELVLFSNSDNERSLSCLVDGELLWSLQTLYSAHAFIPQLRLPIVKMEVTAKKYCVCWL